jgi:hypothetical protein
MTRHSRRRHGSSGLERLPRLFQAGGTDVVAEYLRLLRQGQSLCAGSAEGREQPRRHRVNRIVRRCNFVDRVAK